MNKLLFGTGWHNIETNDNGKFIWSSKESEFILSDNTIRYIDFVFQSDEFTSNSITISHGKFEESFTLVSGINSFKFYPDLSIKLQSKIKIKTIPFCPKNVIPNADDIRELGQRLIAISIDGNVVDLASIMSHVRMFEVNPNKTNTLESMGISTYCLTLKTTPNREEYAIKHLKEHGINANIFYGVDADSMGITSPILNTQQYSKLGDWMTVGSVGCYLSHYMLWQNLNDINDITFIVEDDVVLIPDFVEHFEKFYDIVPADWDIIYVGYESLSGVEHVEVNNKIIKGIPACTYAYMIKKSSIIKFLEAMKTMKYPVDTQIQHELGHTINSYVFSPKLASQKSSIIERNFNDPSFKSMTYDWILDINKVNVKS
jgi:GR25 family glycosyltransferase involved in LPS biosynthesis